MTIDMMLNYIEWRMVYELTGNSRPNRKPRLVKPAWMTRKPGIYLSSSSNNGGSISFSGNYPTDMDWLARMSFETYDKSQAMDDFNAVRR
jgi:hypothetical protein